MHQLEALPRHLDRTLLEADFLRVEAQNPSMPRSPRECLTCAGRGTFRWYGPGTSEPVDWTCDCTAQYKLHVHLLHAGIGLQYQRLSWADADGVEQSAAEVLHEYRSAAEDYVRAGIGLVLIGQKGTGKTLGTVLQAKDLIRDGYDIAVVTMQEFISTFAEGWARDAAGTEAQAWFERRIRNAGVLVLDDLGRESGLQNHVVSILDHVLRHRVKAQLPTLITSNKTLDELATLYSSNAMSLLSECSIEHTFTGSDYRPSARKRRVEEARAGLTRPIVL